MKSPWTFRGSGPRAAFRRAWATGDLKASRRIQSTETPCRSLWYDFRSSNATTPTLLVVGVLPGAPTTSLKCALAHSPPRSRSQGGSGLDVSSEVEKDGYE